MLIVDDIKDIRDMLALVLRVKPGFAVVGEAGNGAEAIERARSIQPDVIVLDLAMPVMDGLAALPGIRAASPGARILVSTGYDNTMRRQAMELGAHGLIVKGATAGEIASAIERVWKA